MFDVNNPADLLALKTEVNTDPFLMGYASATSTNDLLALLNDPEKNLGLETQPAPVTAEALLDAIFDVAISSQDQFKIQLLFEGTEGLNGDLSRFKTKIGALGTSLQNAVDRITRRVSRAEELFADLDENGVLEFVSISRNDWIAARDS